MKHAIQITRADVEVLDFVASRLLNFKRIDHAILLELLNEKFPEQNSDYLLELLIHRQIIKLDISSLVILNKPALEQLLIGYMNIDTSMSLRAAN